jgi:hypothetical protein
MKYLRLILFSMLFTAIAAYAFQAIPPISGSGPRMKGPHDEDVTLPNGKSQREEILKEEYKKNLQEASQLAKISEELRAALEASDEHVVSLKLVKQTEEIEKLAKSIRGRLKR